MMSWADHDRRNRALAAAHAALVAEGILVPLKLGGAEEVAWLDCDLASYAENRLGELCDPFQWGEWSRDRWRATALLEYEPLPMPRKRKSEACYWIERDGRRVGTLALARFCLGEFVGVYSVYLRPQHRGKRIMAETLRAVHAELEARGLGIRLETSWTWQPAVRFYLRAGFWLRSWKRDLAFVRPALAPPPVIAVGATEATVAIDVQGQTAVLARARRAGSRLVEHRAEPGLPEGVGDLVHAALTTLALAIALDGWPLIRSRRHWERCRTSDLVHPEALADRIQVWEAWTGSHAWRVHTPRIPGLDYPSWEELEA